MTSSIISSWFSVMCYTTASMFWIVQEHYVERKDLGGIQGGRNNDVSGEILQLTVKMVYKVSYPTKWKSSSAAM